MTQGPKIVTIDIETAPLKVYTWGIWEQNIPIDGIDTDWSILSFSAKWLNDKKVIFKSTGGRGVDKVRDDRQLMKDLWSILDEADIVVAQNGKAFDVKMINTRMLFLGMKPYSPIKVVDTKIVSKSVFRPTSTRLEFMAAKVTDTPKSKHKKFPGFELWLECLKDNKEAWKEMEKYNSIDVIATEKLYLKMRPWITNHPNVAVYVDTNVVHCPKCGSDRLQKRGSSATAAGIYHRYHCQECGAWSRGKTATNSKEHRKVLLSQG